MSVAAYRALNLQPEDIAETMYFYPNEEVQVGKAKFSTGSFVKVTTKAAAQTEGSSITIGSTSDPLSLEVIRAVDHFVVDEKPMSIEEFQALGLAPAEIAQVEVRKAGHDAEQNAMNVIEVTTKAYLAQLEQPAEDGFFGLKATPNPTDGDLNVEVITSAKGRVQVQVFDAQGRFITTLLDESRPAGVHRLTWPTADMASGTYLIYAQSEQHRGHQRVLVR